TSISSRTFRTTRPGSSSGAICSDCCEGIDMALAVTEHHRELGSVVRAFVDAHDLPGLARQAWDAAPAAKSDVWRRILDVGWSGLHVPERCGGSGYGLMETAVV